MLEPSFVAPPLPGATAFIPARFPRQPLARRARPRLLTACAKPSPSPPEPLPLPSNALARNRAPPGETSQSDRGGLPTLFNGPEGVLGIVLAAAVLLADFARGLVRLATRGGAAGEDAKYVEQRLTDVDDSIVLLQRALDGSKRALAETEASLDATIARASSAEAAMKGIGDSRDRLQKALDQAAVAEVEVRRIQESLRVERGRRESVEESVEERAEESARVQEQVAKREREVSELRDLLATVRESGDGALAEHERRETELAAKIKTRDVELERVREERARLGSEAVEMERRAETMSEQVSAATLALEETRIELERVQADLEKRLAEQEAVEEESAKVVQRSAERERMKEQLREMQGELEEIRRELRTRDKIVDEVSLESDQLASLLAARDAELREVHRRLESAMAAERVPGGDASRSDLSLEEIKSNLDAEQLALSAEIAKAELTQSDIREEDLDPLDRLKKEMNVEEDLLQAGLRKAETTVKLEEHDKNRKQGAVDEVLGSIGEKGDGDEGLQKLFEGLSVADVEGAVREGEVRGEVVDDALAVSKQAQSKVGEREGKPKKRRGRPPKEKSKGEESGEEGGGETPKRKRGRPRKAPSS